MPPLNSTRGTGNITQAIRKVDIAEKVLELQPSATPLTVLSQRLSKARAVNSKFSWTEDDLLPRFDAINNGPGYAAGDLSLVVDNGTYFQADDLVYVTRTGELIRVVSVSTNTLTVIRGVGSSAAALNDNDELYIVSNAAEEGSTQRVAKSTNPVEVINYLEIFKRTVDTTGTLMASEQFTSPHDWDRQRARIAIEHNKDKELAFIFGRPSENTSGTHPRRSTAGVLHYIATNQTDAGGALTETEFFGALRPMFRYGERKKLGMAAGLPVDVLNTYPRSKVQVTDQDGDTYGVEVTRYRSPHGTLNVVRHDLLEGSKFGGYIVVVDLTNVSYRYLANDKESRDTHLRENVQNPGKDGREDEILAECGLQFGLEKTHGVISNITG